MDYEEKIQELLERRADIMARLTLLPYDGTVEIKENKSGRYIYLRKKKGFLLCVKRLITHHKKPY